MCSVVTLPIEAMIAALSGSTALPVIAVFQALLAGKGRLIGAPATGFVTAFVVAAAGALVLAAAEAEADAALPDGVTSEALCEEDSTDEGVMSLVDVAGSLALCVA
jgi:hypothetical protein